MPRKKYRPEGRLQGKSKPPIIKQHKDDFAEFKFILDILEQSYKDHISSIVPESSILEATREYMSKLSFSVHSTHVDIKHNKKHLFCVMKDKTIKKRPDAIKVYSSDDIRWDGVYNECYK